MGFGPAMQTKITPTLTIENLHTYFFQKQSVGKAVNGISLQVAPGEIVALVGESGSGKTVTALSVMRLVPYPGRIVEGTIRLEGFDLSALSDQEIRQTRGKDIAMVFQDASSALNPILTVGEQMRETLDAHLELTRTEADRLCVLLLEQMDLPDAKQLMNRYTFQISGGMAQRVMLAMALAHGPRMLIADEPTSSLDVTIQAEILARLRRLRNDHGVSILLITHDMGVVAQMADRVSVMYAGVIVETADTSTIFNHPTHPYTSALLKAVPRLDNERSALRPIPGVLPNVIELPEQCPFLPRCSKATNICKMSPKPILKELKKGHYIACYNATS